MNFRFQKIGYIPKLWCLGIGMIPTLDTTIYKVGTIIKNGVGIINADEKLTQVVK